MEEMRQLIEQRQGEGTPRSKARNLFGTPTREMGRPEHLCRSMDGLLSEADKDLTRASSNYDSLQNLLKQFSTTFKEVSHL
jgi:hypothetical protein